jgi:signal transduction histidine kinase
VFLRSSRVGGLCTPRLIDAFATLAAFAATLAVLGFHSGSNRHLDVPGVALSAAACFPLLLHRRAPLLVFAVTTSASATMNGLNYALGPPFGPTFALYFIAIDPRTRQRLRRTALVVLGMFAVHIGVTAIAHSGFQTSPVLFGALVWGGAWIIGDQVRQRRQRVGELVERARRAERETARERQLAVAQERARIARDLHDSAAHAINVILVQAGAARLLQQREPGRAGEALETIEEVARETIGEIDRMIRGLREDGQADGVEPPTGAAALGTLADRHRAAGQPVELRVEGVAHALPRAVDQAAYRIVQEALTNAARHGEGGADIEVAYRDSMLELTVTNPVAAGAAAAPNGSGHGILGMRERVGLLGGTLEAGPDGRRFRVHAVLPYNARVERAP